MSSPLQFGGPTSNLPYTYMHAFASPGGLPETIRAASVTQTIPYWTATAATTTSVKTVTSGFPVGWDVSVTPKSVTGFQFWVSTAPSAATQSGAFAVYTGSTTSALARVGSNGAFTLATATTGLKQVAFASPLSVTGTTIVWIGVQFSLTAPGSGVGAALACTPQSVSGLQNVGGKYGEWTGSTVTPGTTLDVASTAVPAVQGQMVWVALY
jgi:hypothetical protein